MNRCVWRVSATVQLETFDLHEKMPHETTDGQTLLGDPVVVIPLTSFGKTIS